MFVKKAENRCINCGQAVGSAQRGRPAKYCSRKCRNKYYNQKNKCREILPSGNARCVYCGKEFVRIENSARKCCTHKCVLRLNRQKEIEDMRKMAHQAVNGNEQTSFRDFVFELYFNGYGRMAIAEALGLTENTIENWARKYEKDLSGRWQRKESEKRRQTILP